MILLAPSSYAHVPWALGLQFIGWALVRALGGSHRVGVWLGAFAGGVMGVTRELTQREYQWIELYGQGLRRNMPDLVGFRVWEWTAHSLAETGTAIAAMTVVALIVSYRSKAH